jgi:hypothetical protein
MGGKKKPKTRIIQGRLPPITRTDPVETVTICHTQTTLIEQHPDYGNQPKVQAAATPVIATCAELDALLTHASHLRLQLLALDERRDQLLATLRHHYGHLESTLNDLAAGDTSVMSSWGMFVPTRTRVEETSAAPSGLRLTLNGTAGAAMARCNAEPQGRAYLFQHGPDPSNIDAWPPPAVVTRAHCEFKGLPIGKMEHFRVAVLRSSTGQSEWSATVGIMIR